MFALLLATAATTPDAVSLSGAWGIVASVEEDRTGNALSAARLAGTRLQYDHTFGDTFFAGAVVGYENLLSRSDYPPNAHVALAGGAFGFRMGEVVRGGLRAGAGFAYGFATLRSPSREVRSPGWYFDIEGEVAVPLSDRFEVFANIPIFLSRTLSVREDPFRRGKWWYAVPLIPLAVNLGLRVRF